MHIHMGIKIVYRYSVLERKEIRGKNMLCLWSMWAIHLMAQHFFAGSGFYEKKILSNFSTKSLWLLFF